MLSIQAITATTSAPISNDIPVLQTAAVNQPRFDHNPVTEESLGLLIEESRTNISPPLNYFNNLSYVQSFGIPNYALAPDGTYSALLVQSVPSPTSVT